MRSTPLDNPRLPDYQATLLLMIASAALSMKAFAGYDFDFLAIDYRAWPGEPWRLLSTCLLHVNVMHLAFNLYWVWRFGVVLEPIFGTPTMVGLYLFLAAGSSAVQWGLSGPGVGLSGIGYGLFGLAYALHRFHPNYRGVIDDGTTQLFILWFFICVLATFNDLLPIGNEAHAGGAVLGLMLGLALSPHARWKRRGILGLVLATTFAALVCTIGRPYLNYSKYRAWELAYDGYVALEADDPERAARALEASVARDETSDAWHNLAIAYLRLGRHKDSARAIQRAESLNTENEAAEEQNGAQAPRSTLRGLSGSDDRSND